MNTGHLGVKTTVCPADRGLSHRGVCNLNLFMIGKVFYKKYISASKEPSFYMFQMFINNKHSTPHQVK